MYIDGFFVLTAGDIPLHLNIRETSDKGQPVVVSSPDSPEVIYTSVLPFIVFRSSGAIGKKFL